MADNIYSCFHYHKKCQEDRQAIEELAPKVMEAASNAAWGNVGDIKYTARTDVPNGGAWCDGAAYAKEDYPDVYKLLTDGKLVSVDMTTFDSSVNLNGSCGFFGLDDTGFKVPLLKDVYLKAGQEADEFGAESLPNITGEIAQWGNVYTHTGVFSQKSQTTTDGVPFSGSGYRTVTDFDASRVSSTYQNGAKVNPDHVKYRAYVVLFLAEKELSIVNWTNQLQSKTDASINQIEAKTDDGVSTLNNLANTYSNEIGYLSGVTSNIQTQLNGKANANADNFSADGKAAIIGWGTPNWNAGVSFSSGYVTPKAGFVVVASERKNSSNNLAYINGKLFFSNVQASSGADSASGTAIVGKGQTITYSGQATTHVFYPFLGGN